MFIPAQVNCWLSPDSARRCSDTLFSKMPSHFLQVDNGNVNDRSVTISLIDSRQSVRRLSVDGEDSPRHASSDFHRRSTQALLSDKDESLIDTTSGRNAISAASNSHHQTEDDSSPLLKPYDNNHRHVDSSVSSAGSSPLPSNNNNSVLKPNGSSRS